MGRVSAKKARKADGEAARAAAESAACAAKAAATAARSAALSEEAKARHETAMKLSEQFRKLVSTPLTPEELEQRKQQQEKLHNETWERLRDNWFYEHIPFDSITEIPCMRYTEADLDDHDYPYIRARSDTLQIVSVQLKEFSDDLHWPLDVYGFIAVRDFLDRKRNMVFYRGRDDCQTVNKEDSYLRLTGPTRGVLINVGPSHLEVVLKLKGLTDSESEDKVLSSFAMTYGLGCFDPFEYTSKLCTLEMQHYTVFFSVEATVSVRVFQGQLPHGFRGVLNATTPGKKEIQIALLNLNDDELHVDADGFIKLSRRVVCVEDGGRLGVSLFENGVSEEGAVWFVAEKSGRLTNYMHVKKFSLWLEVTVAWSLF